MLDANTLVSALLLKSSVPRQAFDKAIKTGKVLLSIATMSELNEVLERDKFKKYITYVERTLFVKMLISQSTFIEVTNTVAACRDPKDNKFLELATEGKAGCIISGDRDLLVMNPFNEINIITPKEFLVHY